jgi:CubicO group peptidase (beta-lactamase class C family)
MKIHILIALVAMSVFPEMVWALEPIHSAPTEAEPPSATPMTRADVETFVDGIMSQRLERDDIAGAAIAIVKDGSVLFEKGYGYADVAKKTPVSPDETLFSIASISKLFAATAVMQLVAQGELDLDVDVGKYLDFELKQNFPEPITLRRLLTHTAGFEEGGKDDLEPPNAISKLGEFLRTHQPAQIFRPGARIAYSNYGVSLAGYVVERVSGEPFAAYVAHYIYEPLGMKHSTFEAPIPPALAPLASKEYWLASQPPRAIEYLARRPAGGMFSTADDMTRFMIAHLQDGRYGDQRILTDAAARTMHTIQWRGQSDAPGIAISFYQNVGNGRLVLAHGGDLACQHSYLWLMPAERLGVFLVFNSSGTDWTRIRGSIWKAFLDRYFPSSRQAPEPSATARKDAIAVAGTYLTTRRAQTSILSILYFLTPVKVSANADNSISMDGVTYDNGTPKKYLSMGNLLFRDPGGHTLAFVRGSSGSVEAMIADGVGEYEAQRGALSGHIQLVILLGAILTLALSVLMWPISAIARWRYRRPLHEELNAAARHRELIVRGTSIVALAGVVLAGIYLAALARLELQLLSGGTDPYIRLFQILALLVIIGSAYSVWNTVIAWRRREGAFLHRLGSTAVGMALVTMTLFIVTYHLLAIRLNY